MEVCESNLQTAREDVISKIPFRIIIVTKQSNNRNTKSILRAGEMAHQVKVLAVQAWQPEFYPQNLKKDRKRKAVPPSGPLTSVCTLWQECSHTQ